MESGKDDQETKRKEKRKQHNQKDNKNHKNHLTKKQNNKPVENSKMKKQ